MASLHRAQYTPNQSYFRIPVSELELELSEWRAAVGVGGALYFLENVQLGHRHSFQGALHCLAGDEQYAFF